MMCPECGNQCEQGAGGIYGCPICGYREEEPEQERNDRED